MAHPFRKLVPLLVLIAAAVAAPGRGHGDEGGGRPHEVVVVVNAANRSPDPSFEDLHAILTLERQFWKDGKRIVLLLPASGSVEKGVLLEKIYRRTDAQLREDWAKRLFAGQIPAVPTLLRSVEALLSAVKRSPGAIAVVPATAPVPDHVRVLAIGGKHSGEAGYALVANGS